MSADVHAFLLAAGRGTRLRPLTDWTPKCLVTVAGRPLLAYWLDLLEEAGISAATINTHHLASRVRSFLARARSWSSVRVTEAFEEQLLGSAGTLAAHPNFADDGSDVILVCADNFSNVDLRQMLEFHRSHGDPVTMLLYRTPTPKSCGIAELDDEQRIISFVEKPANPVSNLANGAVYIVRSDAYREMAAMGGHDLGFDVLPRFVGRMRGWCPEAYHRDVGTPEALAEARAVASELLVAGRSVRIRRRPAVFLDRDGTILRHEPYLSHPSRVRLLPGAAEAMARLQQAGYALIVVTNQSAVGRGWMTEDDLSAVHEEMRSQLAGYGVDLDGVYHCPLAPQTGDRQTVEHPDRKPGPGMLLRAGRDLELDLSASWMIGDMLSDVLAGRNAGCRGNILVQTGPESAAATQQLPASAHTCDDLAAAADEILTRHPAIRHKSGSISLIPLSAVSEVTT